MAELKICFTRVLNVEIGDYELTQTEIDDLAEKELFENLPGDAIDYSSEWKNAPKAKDFAIPPLEDYWADSIIGPVATNGWIMVLKHFSLPSNFVLELPWLEKEMLKNLDKMSGWFSPDYLSLPLHTGFFRKTYACFRDLPRMEVRGKDADSQGYLTVDGKLCAILMPFADGRAPENAIKFH